MDEGGDQAISKAFWRRQGLHHVINLDGDTFHAEKYIKFFLQMPGEMETLACPLPMETQSLP